MLLTSNRIPTTSDFIADIVFKLININFVKSEIFNLTLMEKPAGTYNYLHQRLKIYKDTWFIDRTHFKSELHNTG